MINPPVKPSTAERNRVAAIAREAFWRAVVVEFSQVTDGDLPPDTVYQFDTVTEATVSEWVELNWPEPPVTLQDIAEQLAGVADQLARYVRTAPPSRDFGIRVVGR